MKFIEEVTERPAIPVASLPDDTQSPPPGVPIPLFSQQMWLNWRTHFFTYWRWNPIKLIRKTIVPYLPNASLATNVEERTFITTKAQRRL